MRARVLLLSPSRGLGGGIERFVSTVEAAFTYHAVPYQRLDLCTAQRPASPGARLGFTWEVIRAAHAAPGPVQLVIAHVNLLPVIRPVARLASLAGATVYLHGREIWARRGIRHRQLLRRKDVRTVVASSFSAGALIGTCPATVLNPGIAGAWYDTLVNAEPPEEPRSDRKQLVTTFRLADWHHKGLDTVMRAIELVGDQRVRLTVCGTGPVPQELAAAVERRRWCRLAVDLPDRMLARQLAGADLFVLATRTRAGRDAYGEGFGLALLEAQLAGAPVVAPAHGGSGDAFQPGLTGLAPVDESPYALAHVLAELLADDRRRGELARAAATWSRLRFEPSSYSRRLATALLGEIPTWQSGGGVTLPRDRRGAAVATAGHGAA